MTAYGLLKLLHVLAAVLGTGAVSALVLGARSAPPALAMKVARWAGMSLGVVFLTGVGIDWLVAGAYHQLPWFRLAGLTLFITAGVLAFVRRALAQEAAGKLDPQRARARVQAGAWLAVALVGCAVVLMESRTF